MAKMERQRLNKVRTCKGVHEEGKKKPVWRGGTTWRWCKACEEFFLCPGCLRDQGWMLVEHKKICDKNLMIFR
jgi:hypothetical protein